VSEYVQVHASIRWLAYGAIVCALWLDLLLQAPLMALAATICSGAVLVYTTMARIPLASVKRFAQVVVMCWPISMLCGHLADEALFRRAEQVRATLLEENDDAKKSKMFRDQCGTHCGFLAHRITYIPAIDGASPRLALFLFYERRAMIDIASGSITYEGGYRSY
jgi:hypothetical protein